MSFYSIKGIVTLNNALSPAQKLMGLFIEIYTVEQQEIPEGLWLGASRIDEKGLFEVKYFSEEGALDDVIYKVYNGVQLITTASIHNTGLLNIAINQELYDQNIQDDTRRKTHIDYAILNGSVKLNSKGVPAIPLDRDDVLLILKKVKFREKVNIAVTTIDQFGNYEIKIPYKTLFPKVEFEYNKLPQIIIDIEVDEEIIGSSDLISLTDNFITTDIVINDQEAYDYFHTEYTAVSNIINDITDLDEEDYRTITTIGEYPEINVVVTNSGLGFETINNMVLSSVLNSESDVPMQHLYALIREGKRDIGAINALGPEEIESIIEDAYESHIIPSLGDVEETIKLLFDENIKRELEDKNDDDISLSAILESILGSPSLVKEFMDIREKNQLLSVEELWAEVDSEMGNTNLLKLQSGFQIIAVAGLQREMVNAFMNLQAPFPQYIAQSSVNTIQSFIQQVCITHQKLCVPRSVRGDVPVQDFNNTTVHNTYAQKINEIGKQLFASNVIIDRLANDQQFSAKFTNPNNISQFLSQNKEFDFRVNNVWDTNLNINDALRNDLMPLQNMTRLTSGRIDLVVSLIKNDIKSSHQIAVLSESEFQSILGQVQYDSSVISSIYKKANQIDFQVKNTYTQIYPGNFTEKATLNYNPDIWKQNQQPVSGYPDYESLFGDMDFCTCSDCSSMYSPSAYFTDLFNFIKTRLGSSLAYNELVRRRPDLPHIDISCKNANTPLPYIDLVNELLELIILKDIKAHDEGESGLFIPLSFQTSALAQELEAYPEHTYKDIEGTYKEYMHYVKVYDKRVNKAIYPNSLPFNLALEESRIFLDHMDRSRYNLMKAYTPVGYTLNMDPDKINEYNQAAEWFLLSRIEADIISKNPNPDIPEDLWEYYGFSTEGTWYDDLCNDLETLLKRSGIEYKELLQLLITDFINPLSGSPAQRPFAIVSKPGRPVDSCNLDDLMLEYRQIDDEDVDEAKILFFDKLHRFIRLSRASKWSIYQLDIMLSSFSATDIDTDVFILTYKASLISSQYNIQPEIAAILWSDINTTRYINFNSSKQEDIPSVYDNFFRNRGIINPVDPHFVNPDSITGTIEDNKATILAAFNISENDILAAFDGDLDTATTLSNLSRLYSLILSFKVMSRSSVSEMKDQLATLGSEMPAGTVEERIDGSMEIFHQMESVDQSVFSWSELKYIFRHQDTDNQFMQPDGLIRNFYESLRAELNRSLNNFDLELDPLEHPEVEIVKARLKKIAIQEFAATFNLDYELMQYLLSEKLQIGIIPDVVLDILITNDFINSILPITRENTIDILDFEDLYGLYDRLSKSSLILSGLRISSDLFMFLQEKCTVLSTSDIEDFPVEELTESDTLLINDFFRLNDWIKLRDTFSFSDDILKKLIISSTDSLAEDNELWRELIVTYTGWNNEDLYFLLEEGVDTSLGALNYSFNPTTIEDNDYRLAKVLLQLDDIMKNATRVGLIVKTIYTALLPDIDSDLSLLLRKTTKAKYEDEQWYRIIKPLQDALRRKQRDALVAYLLAHPDIIPDNNMKWKNEHDLFAYLLIDVEMESCMKTSRLKQGISSLQLFLDRIVMNIEKVNSTGFIISMDESVTAQWQTWRKWYRIWEANRKVFLYPENWIEPELRDNKSPLFKDLEAFLLQDDPTDSYVEEGFKQYLDGLEDIARLEPVSAYHEYGGSIDIFHVIARTNIRPHLYYYRKLEDNEWSSWERIEIDIKSDHVAPVIFNNKLHIFWLTFVDRKNIYPIPPLTSTPPSKKWIDVLNTTDGGYKQYRILPVEEDGRETTCDVLLNWTYLQNGRWQKQQSGKETMQMEIGRYEINSTAQDTYGSSESTRAFDIFTKRGDITQQDFFKNRIYLFTPDYKYSADEGIVFNLIFPGGWDESGKGFHSFRWLGDVTREPVVVKDTEYSWTLLAPYGSRFNKMKFEQDKNLGNQLKTDTTYDRVKTGHYTYSDNVFINNTNTWYRKGAPLTILNNTPFGSFRLTGLAANKQFNDLDFNRIEKRFFYEDNRNTYYVEKVSTSSTYQAYLSSLLSVGKISPASAFAYALANYPLVVTADVNHDDVFPMVDKSSIAKSLGTENYLFHTFYHAQINKFTGLLNRDGVSGLLKLGNQSQVDTMNFSGNYQPTSMVNSLYPKNNVQFGYGEPYSIYNWELFFHAPMMIAQRLSNNMQFEDAQKWYHYIFNPTSNTNISGAVINTNQRFWKFYPFYAESGYPAQTLSQLLVAIHNNNTAAVAQVKKWEKNPFNPHLIARMRILAYMKNVLMKYLDNLIAWGDHLYRRDTIESINEATQLYILASNILGDRPTKIPPRVKRNDYTFDELSAMGLDILSNALVEIESFYAPNDAPSGSGFYSTESGSNNPQEQDTKIPLHTFYFCLPPNEKMLQYWDTIADRLFKIRNCMSLDGIERQLPLYEPPIDPALLVRATAMGIDVNAVLDEVYGVNSPHYRFVYIVQKANEIINDVKSLGGAVLSALEKKDAENLSLLRSTHEISLLEKIRLIKIQQINESIAALEALYLTKETTQIRLTYYSTREYMNSREYSQQSHLQKAKDMQVIQGVLQTVAGVLSAIPTFHVQAIASGMSSGGLQLANVCQAASTAVGIKTTIENFKASESGIMAGYDRRKDDWDFQKASAAKEIQQLDRQILAAEIRLDIAQKELVNHDLQIENSLQVDTFMRSKFSNADLYNWMSSQLASVYFQSYQLAYETALKADFCYRYELPERSYPSDGFIKFGYWDSLKKGLLSGERLQLDVRRMETAYMDENARELELTKHISLAIFSPESILEIKRTGSCTVDIPELIYDLDYPGHYMRRIKSISLSIPCIAGPYTTINCQLSQSSSKYRKEKTVIDDYNNDANFTFVNNHMIIATSSGQNDGGVFELNFRDERYLPFEGTGAISSWIITFPDEYRQFDYDTITDVIMHINYTARFDGGLATDAKANIKTVFETLGPNNILHRFFSIKHEYSNEWFAYMKALEMETEEPLTILIKPNNFPFFTKERDITIKKWHLQLHPKRNGIIVDVEDMTAGIDVTLEDNALESSGTVTLAVTDAGLELKIDMSFNSGYDITDIEDIYLVADYILEDI